MEERWCCAGCAKLLGVRDRMRFCLRYKQVQYLVEGTDYRIRTRCRACAVENERRVLQEVAAKT
jgi:hypothetical protein